MEKRIRDGELDNKLPYSRETREAHRTETHLLEALFKAEALKAVGLENYPLRDKVADKAWSDGHSSGYMEVYHQLVELAEMIAPTSSLFKAVINVLTVEEENLAEANGILLEEAIGLGLVTEEECNFG